MRSFVFSFVLVLSSGGRNFSASASPAPVDSQWVDGGTYRFKVDGTRRCGPIKMAGGAGQNKPTDPRDPATLLGFLVRIEARRAGFFVSPHDLTLEAGGVVLEALLSPPEGSLRCAPLLNYTRLGAGRVARGYVVFRVPSAFRASPPPITVVYRPTRWGGSGRAAIEVPRCLDVCSTPAPIAVQGRRKAER